MNARSDVRYFRRVPGHLAKFFTFRVRLPIPTVTKRKSTSEESEDSPSEKRRKIREILKTNPDAGMQVHGVPLEERAFDSKGNRLPWAYEYLEFVHFAPLICSDVY